MTTAYKPVPVEEIVDLYAQGKSFSAWNKLIECFKTEFERGLPPDTRKEACQLSKALESRAKHRAMRQAAASSRAIHKTDFGGYIGPCLEDEWQK